MKKRIGFLLVCLLAVVLSACGKETVTSGIEQDVSAEPESSVSSIQETDTEMDREHEIDLSQLSSVDVGGIVYFGSYEQNNNLSDGAEQIAWLVLEKDEDRLLLISQYALDCQPYHTEEEDVTWENCSLRSWLNSSFFDTAFSEEEKAVISVTTVTADGNPEYDTDNGQDTTDSVFLLSIPEAERYFDSDELRQCSPTAYVEANSQEIILNDAGNSKWWLRTSGKSNLCGTTVFSGGSVNYSGYDVRDISGTVRPSIWIDLNKQ